jgi:RimJ/RimL family protein N-acetyltransferase
MPHEVQGQRLLGDDSTASRGSDGAPAGTIGLLSASPQNLSVEIGRVKIFPPYQRTHVASNAVGLLLQYTLNTPIPPTGMNRETHSGGTSGLGLRRVTWISHPLNEPSIRLARRLGFKLEATLRWDRALPPGKEDASNGHGIRCGDPKPDWTGWDTVLLSICWDDWELDGGRERVEEDMRRVR